MGRRVMETEKRWYQADPRLAQALEAWEQFPHGLQVLVADYINQRLQTGLDDTGRPPDPDINQQITQKQVLGLYMAGQKRRWHDSDPDLRSAVNALSIAPLDQQVDIAQRILKIHDLLIGQGYSDGEMSEELLVAMVGEMVERILRAP